MDPFAQVIDAYKAAVLAKDVNAFVSLYDDNVVVFDLWGTWAMRGVASWRHAIGEWFSSVGSEQVVVSFRDASSLASDELAVGHAIVTYAAFSPEGTPLRSLSNRLTMTLKRSQGTWRIVHEHTSAPVDPSTLKAEIHYKDATKCSTPHLSTQTQGAVMWTHEESIDITATPARIWRLFADVPGWKSWNAGIERIELHGPFTTGATFTMQPPGMDAFVSTLIDVQEHTGFTDETVVDDTRVIVEHRIESQASGQSRVVYSTRITGPDAEEIGPMVTGDFGDVLRALKEMAERG